VSCSEPSDGLALDDIDRCFAGSIPAVISTASADGTPNVTYLSRAHKVDGERLALSNQFFSKTSRNLADNPRASLLLIDPITYDEYRLTLVYERTERHGKVFDDLRTDVDAVAAMTGMQDVFRLRAADIYRVQRVEVVNPGRADLPAQRPMHSDVELGALAELCGRLGRCQDLETLVVSAVDGLDRLLGYHHVQLMLLDEEGRRLYTIASRGFDAEGVGAEAVVGEGLVGMAAAQGAPLRIGNLQQMAKYSRTVRRSFEREGVAMGREIPMPGLPDADSRLVVPALSMGEIVGVLVVDSAAPVAFDERDEAVVSTVAAVLGGAMEAVRAAERELGPVAATVPPLTPGHPTGTARVRFYETDGSVFLDGDYLIKGVAGRILWSLLRQHQSEGRTDFTNRELRRDPTLDMPGFKDNLESRLILLKRRLDERGAPVRIDRTGRGRFRLDVTAGITLEAGEVDTA
jgi:predicted pyridoxine 5'-phosphate oxidase superfamily flavin-nucleotide-binding protein